MKSALTRMFANAEPAVAKLETLQAHARPPDRAPSRHPDPGARARKA